MANLSIKTKLEKLIVVGEFCNWELDNALVVEKRKGKQYNTITIEDMPNGLYKVLDSKSFVFGEEKMFNGEVVPNRYFNGQADETIVAFY